MLRALERQNELRDWYLAVFYWLSEPPADSAPYILVQHPLDTFTVAQLGQDVAHAAALKDEFISLGATMWHQLILHVHRVLKTWVHPMDLKGCIIWLGGPVRNMTWTNYKDFLIGK